MFEAVELSRRGLSEAEHLYEGTVELIRQLCAIPAPSHHEEKRAEFIREWWQSRGMEAEIDDALNVRCPVNVGEDGDIVVIMAHTDTVFPDTEPMELSVREDRMYCPGIGDDTTNLAALMQISAEIHNKNLPPRCGVLFVANSCEEGLGNLKGCRAIMRDFGTRVKAFLSLDGDLTSVCNKAVGSARYKIRIRTEGGHSYANFGNRNAIAEMAELVCLLYQQKVPELPDSTTTYNVGKIEGGTSVNAIAQNAEMLYEYRSDNPQCLEIMKKQLDEVLAWADSKGYETEIELLGVRPCGSAADPAQQEALDKGAYQALRRYYGKAPRFSSGSTDCNIPLSMGIPSVCFGVYEGDGEHTREEWIRPLSLKKGIPAVMSFILGFFSPVK